MTTPRAGPGRGGFRGRWLAVGVLLAGAATGCASREAAQGAGASPPADWIAWQAARHESIAGTNGWMTLVGLHWLDGEANSANSDPTNRGVALAPGRFVRRGRHVRFEAAPGVTARIAGEPVQTADLESDRAGPPTRLQVGTLTFTVIERGERIGLRVRDSAAPGRLQFAGLRYFPYDPSWRLTGRFEAFAEPRTMRVLDVTGGTQFLDSPGALVFEAGGGEHRLDVVEEAADEPYFVIFRDRTAGDATYSAGRFLWVDRPDAAGRVMIDFNRAYNPPCAFTPLATCPLPPPQNVLPFAVTAGERKPAEGSGAH